jgi:hypothetical protein
MFVISLSSCSRYNANFKFDQTVLTIHDSTLHILRSVRMTTHSTPLVSDARDHWWTLDFANAFVSTGVNSRGGISTLAPGLRPERRSAPLARGWNEMKWNEMKRDDFEVKLVTFVHIASVNCSNDNYRYMSHLELWIRCKLENTCMQKPSPCWQNHCIFQTWSI